MDKNINVNTDIEHDKTQQVPGLQEWRNKDWKDLNSKEKILRISEGIFFVLCVAGSMVYYEDQEQKNTKPAIQKGEAITDLMTVAGENPHIICLGVEHSVLTTLQELGKDVSGQAVIVENDQETNGVAVRFELKDAAKTREMRRNADGHFEIEPEVEFLKNPSLAQHVYSLLKLNSDQCDEFMEFERMQK